MAKFFFRNTLEQLYDLQRGVNTVIALSDFGLTWVGKSAKLNNGVDMVTQRCKQNWSENVQDL